MAKVNTPKYPDLAEKYGIRAFPTILFFEHGKEPITYNSDRTADGVVEFIVRKTHPEMTVNPANCELINDAKEAQSVLTYFGDTSDPDYKDIYLPAALEAEDIRFFSSDDKSCAKSNYGKITLF